MYKAHAGGRGHEVHGASAGCQRSGGIRARRLARARGHVYARSFLRSQIYLLAAIFRLLLTPSATTGERAADRGRAECAHQSRPERSPGTGLA